MTQVTHVMDVTESIHEVDLFDKCIKKANCTDIHDKYILDEHWETLTNKQKNECINLLTHAMGIAEENPRYFDIYIWKCLEYLIDYLYTGDDNSFTKYLMEFKIV